MNFIFNSAEDLCDLFTELFRKIGQNSTLAAKMAEINQVIRFHFTNPKVEITVDATQQPLLVICGAAEKAPDLQLWLAGDIAHQLWLGKISPMSAIMSRQIRAVGKMQSMREIGAVFSSVTKIYQDLLLEKSQRVLTK